MRVRWSHAPSMVRRVKTDAPDAMLLARLLKLDELAAVTVPSIEAESARDLVRAREECRGDLMSARHRLSTLLLRQGIVSLRVLVRTVPSAGLDHPIARELAGWCWSLAVMD